MLSKSAADLLEETTTRGIVINVLISTYLEVWYLPHHTL